MNAASIRFGPNVRWPAVQLFIDRAGERCTCIDEELVGQAWVVDVVYGAGEYRRQNFQVAEHVLTTAGDKTTFGGSQHL